MAANTKNYIFQFVMIFSVLVVAFSVAFYLIYYLPKKLDYQKQKEAKIRGELEQQVEENQRLVGISECQKYASDSAVELLKTKAKLSPELFGAAAKEGLYLKPDYETYYQECLERKGI